MRILFVVNEIPFPPDNGVRIVSHNAMQLMKAAGHTLALAVLTQESEALTERFNRAAALCEPAMSLLHPLPLKPRWQVLLSALARGALFFNERYRCPAFGKKLEQLIQRFKPDVVHIDIITMCQYRSLIPPGIGTVASINDSYALTLKNQLRVDHFGWLETLYRRRQLRATQGFERRSYAQFDAVHVMSAVDAKYLQQLNPNIHAQVIPNGAPQALLALPAETRGNSQLVFVAKLAQDNLVNLRKFLLTSWPLVIGAFPQAHLKIVGKLTAEAEALNSALGHLPGIEFVGYLDDLTEAYRSAGIAVVPIDKNCGIINKALEAMAAGLAVVGFANAFAGISGAQAGEHYLAADDYRGLGEAIVTLLSDAAKRCALQAAAAELIGLKHTWALRAQDYENLYQSAARRALAEPVTAQACRVY